MENNYQMEGMTMAVVNMDAMVKFYSDVFEISFEAKELFNSKLYSGRWGELNLLFCPAEIARNTAQQNRHQFDIVVPDIQKTIELATAAGGKVMGEVVEDKHGFSVGICDPDNNSITFKEYN